MSDPLAPGAEGGIAVAVRPRLPAPTRTRWQPLRLGLVNLYRFDDETFAFEDGRLLLRGNNGTGKSRVLALTLPFLFDGRIEPHRVEPDGDPAKRMEWNLLLGRYDDRLGYAWLEFGRQAPPDDGAKPPEDRFITIGCGLRAGAGRGAPRTWFFVTDQRVGGELRLVTETGQPLTRERLVEAIGDRGHVVDTATEYRRLVDRALFNLGEYRYEALVDLLIQLRRPQLSRHLDESLLSAALSEALPPLPQAVIADVAEAFRALDDDRDQLERFQAALAATTTFLDHYRGYAGIAARRRATAVTQANSRYEQSRADLRDAERRRDEAEIELARLDGRQLELKEETRAAAVEVHTIETSAEMAAARSLEEARARADELAREAAERADDLRRAEAEFERRINALGQADEAAARTRSGADTAIAHADDAAAAAGLSALHRRLLAPLTLPDARDDAAIAAARHAIQEAVTRSREGAQHLLELDGEVKQAAAALVSARERLGERSAALDHARDAAAEAEAALTAAREATVAALHDWAAARVELDPIPVDDIADDVLAWDGAGASPITAAVDRAANAARDRLSRAAAGVDARLRELDDERAELAAERDALAAGAHRPPPAPHTRDAAAREGHAGAPLWRLLDLRPDIHPADAAGYEAALEASGLLDAWVTPDGALLDADDTVLIAADTPARDDGGLTRVVVPATAPDDGRAAQVPQEHVAALLARIGAREDGEVWVAPDGRWRVGPLHGRWRKAAAEHLGHAARERARRRRIAELDAQLAALDARRAELVREREDVERRIAAVDEERAAAPSEEPIRRAAIAATHAAREVRHHRERVDVAEAEVRVCHERLDRATITRDQTAADLGFAGRAADPAALLTDIDGYRVALTELWAAVTEHAAALRALDAATVELDRAAEERDVRLAQSRAATQAATDAATRRDTLEATVGRAAAEVVVRLEAARVRQAELERRIEALAREREEQLKARERHATRAEDAARQLEEHTRIRAREVERLRRLVRAGFLEVAGVRLDAAPPPGDAAWAPDPAVRAARRINDALAHVRANDADWERVQRAMHGHYTTLEQALLPHGLPAAATLDDELFLVTTTFQGRTSSMPELRDFLSDEVLHRQSILDAREREVLENHLVGEVATQLHELIRRGEAFVSDMNAELAARPTSTGMRLRFRWQPRPDGPEALADARRRLLAADHVWSPEDRAALGAFLQARIREVRDADDAGTWQQHLTRALDYRHWHVFTVEREQDGSWVRLTRRTHGTGSGGEKALALTVPQFAAAAAHYRSADPHAPRLIALDEAFVGIDNDMRAKCMDLLVRFDLDVAMTSEREWACYPTVPAIAIYQLATRPGIDAVGVHRWVWNGRDRLEVRPQPEDAP